MSERDDLLISIASTIRTYREGDISEPSPAHVDRWASQFSANGQLPFLREFNHVMRRSFISKELMRKFLGKVASLTSMTGNDPQAFWARVGLLDIQKKGNSQREMLGLFTEVLREVHGVTPRINPVDCDEFIYLDDYLFSASRLINDLREWIGVTGRSAVKVYAIVMASYAGGEYRISQSGMDYIVANSGKKLDLKLRRHCPLENRLALRDDADVLWPCEAPDDPAVREFLASEERFPLVVRNPGGKSRIFSCEEGRQALEREFLISGARIRAMALEPSAWMRPLGFSRFAAGFGATLVTYRNCPNNCPLALWWGDPDATAGALHWYPLLPRKTYANSGSVLDVFD